MKNKNVMAPWQPAQLPAPPMPRGLGWLGVVGPGVIVLGVSIGSGEFLLGPAVFVQARPVAAVGHGGRGLPPDHVQHRADALHAGDGRAGVHRLHAHAPVVDVLGVVLRGRSISCRSGWPAWAGDRGRRDLLPVRASGSPVAGRCRRRLLHRRRDVPLRASRAARRATHRAHARDPQLGAGRVHPRQLPRARACSSCRPATWVARRRRLRRLRHGARARSISCRPASTSSCSARSSPTPGAAACTTSRCRTGRATRATAWAQRAGYIPAAVGGQKVNLAHTGFMFTPDAEAMRALARLVAHRARRSVGRVLHRARCSAWCCRRCCT